MNARKITALVFAPLVSMLLLSNAALATNGYFTHGVGAKSKGMAGTGVGSSANMGAMMSATNPALAMFAGDGWEAGLSIFSPRRSYSASASLANGQGGAFTIGQGSFDSSSEWFPIPNVGKKWDFGEDAAITFLFYGRGGMNTDWDNSDATAIFDPDGPGPAPVMTLPGPFGGGKGGVDLSQAFLSLSYASQPSDNFAWGGGPVFALQSFEANGVSTFAGFTRTFAASGGTEMPTNLSDNGHEITTGFGFAGGVWFGLSESASVGLSYTSKMSMGEFDDYADLFAESGGFDIPASTKLGLSFVANQDWRINFDVEFTQYSEIDSVGNPMANLGGCPTAGLGGTDIESCLGGATGGGFGWDDMTTYKIGAEWNQSSDFTWRFGYSFGEQPIQTQDVVFNILAPGVMEQHFTFGVTRHRPDGGDWTFSLMFAPEKKVTGPNMFDPTQTIELKMNQLELEFAYTW